MKYNAIKLTKQMNYKRISTMYCYWGWESVAIAANSCTIADQLLANQSADCFVIDGNGQTSLLPASAASQLRSHYILILSYMNYLLLSFSVREILYFEFAYKQTPWKSSGICIIFKIVYFITSCISEWMIEETFICITQTK